MGLDKHLKIIGVTVDSVRQGVTPCYSLNRGIYNASTKGNAKFVVVNTFLYMSGGSLKSESWDQLVAEAKNLGAADSTNVAIEGQAFTLASKIDSSSQITLSSELRNRDGGADDPVSDAPPHTEPV